MSDGSRNEDDELERTQQDAKSRRDSARQRYERAADRGTKKRKRKRKRRDRADRYAHVVKRLERLPLNTVLEVALTLAVAGSVLALGSVHPPVMAAVGVMSAIALAAALMVRDRDSPRIVGPAVVCWALAGWCVVQLIPLPIAWLEAIAPTNADTWQRALLPFAEAGPSFAPVSLDPGATAIETVRWFSYGAIFVAAAQVSASRSAGWVLRMIFAVAILTALSTLAHGLAGMTKVYGFYEPTFGVNKWHVGPLLNPNNLAGLLNLGAMCGLGLMLSERRNTIPWIVVTGVALILGVGVISASRGGVLLMFVGVVLLAISVELPNRRASREQPVGRARVMLLATVVLGGILAVLGGRRAIWNELLDENMEKLRLVSTVEPAVGDFAIVGMGRGSFESVFAFYQKAEGGVVFTHAENFVAQWLVEWGAPATIVALLALGYFLRPNRLGVTKSSLAAAAFIGVLIMLLQNLVDLGLEVPGLVVAIAATLGALWGDSDLFREPRRPAVARSRSIGFGLGALTLGVLLSVGGYAWGKQGVSADRTALREQLLAHKMPRDPAQIAALRADLRAAMLRHPAEPYFALLGAELAWEERTGDAIPWLQRALERSAVNGRAHFLLARVLRRHGALNQALLELRLAVEAEGRLVGHAARDAGRWTKTMEDLERAEPSGPLRAQFWESAAAHITDRSRGALCDRRALELDPGLMGSRNRLVEDILRDRKSGDRCTGDDEERCAEELEEHAQAAATHAPESSLAVRMRARWLLATGNNVEAEKMLADGCEGANDAAVCLKTRAEAAAAIPSAEPFGEAAKALRRAQCANRQACGEINVWIGNNHMARKEHALAVTAFEKAVRDHPTEARLELLANAAVAAGLSSRAARAFERLIERTQDETKKTEYLKKRREVMSRMIR